MYQARELGHIRFRHAPPDDLWCADAKPCHLRAPRQADGAREDIRRAEPQRCLMTAAPFPSVEGELMRGGYAGSGREDRQSVAGKRASQRLCGRYRGRGVRMAVVKPVKEP